jgi:ATP-dependent DNA ligase
MKPELVGVVKYMMRTKSGGMRQPVFKGLREDKKATDCIDHNIIE